MNLNPKLPIFFYESCIPTKGYKNSIVCDLRRGKIYPIESDIIDLVESCQTSIENSLEIFDQMSRVNVLEYLKQMVDLELVHQYNNENFSPLELFYESPYHIENMIVEYGSYLNKNIQKFCREVNVLGVQALELRFYDPEQPALIESLIEKLNSTRLKDITLILPSEMIIDFEKLIVINQTISSIVVFGADKNDVIQLKLGHIQMTKLKIRDNSCCGNIYAGGFVSNRKMNLQSRNENSCLSKKMALTTLAEIKNCPSTNETYGIFPVNSLLNIAINIEFQKLWKVNKDQIQVCRDCEYRYVCVDCRAHLSKKDDIYSKPLKCNYDPYVGKWL